MDAQYSWPVSSRYYIVIAVLNPRYRLVSFPDSSSERLGMRLWRYICIPTLASFPGLQSQLTRWKAWWNSYEEWCQVDVWRRGLPHRACTITAVHRKCHASKRPPDVILHRSFTRPSTTLAVIEGLGQRLLGGYFYTVIGQSIPLTCYNLFINTVVDK